MSPDKLADFIEGWDRFILESGAGDWLDTKELSDVDRAMVIAALRFYAQYATY